MKKTLIIILSLMVFSYANFINSFAYGRYPTGHPCKDNYGCANNSCEFHCTNPKYVTCRKKCSSLPSKNDERYNCINKCGTCEEEKGVCR